LLSHTCAIRVDDNGGFDSESLTTPVEYEDFFYSSDGFNMLRSQAHELAMKEARELDACGVTIEYLKKLKQVLFSSNGFDMLQSDVKSIIFTLAKQHVDPDSLLKTFKGLYTSDGLDMMKSDAKKMAFGFIGQDVSPIDEIVAIFKFLYSSGGANMMKSEARSRAIEAGHAGCEAGYFAEGYKKSRDFKWALDEAVPKSLAGQAMRYASDGQAYTAAQFRSYYKDSWLTEWQKSPPVMKVAQDGKAYTASQFKAYFGAASWEQQWQTAMWATQMRIADDGVPYNLESFAKYYGNSWQQKWVSAPQVLCRKCRTW